jgi:hypothetical protein
MNSLSFQGSRIQTAASVAVLCNCVWTAKSSAIKALSAQSSNREWVHRYASSENTNPMNFVAAPVRDLEPGQQIPA